MKRCVVIFALVVAAGLSQPARADDPPPFPEFTFKRIGLPAQGTARRITVQIEAAPEVDILPEAAPLPAGAGAYDWFWSVVSPDAAQAGPVNLARALELLDGRDEGPRLQALQDIAQRHGIEILKATVGTRISPALVLALISVESAGDQQARSGAGAEGLMQLIPATAARFGVTDSYAPDQNIAGGVAYLDWLMQTFDNDPILALAGYNAGENAVIGNRGVPPFDETRAYVPRVLMAWRVARGLCLTPPQLITDGCVFALKGTPPNG